MNPGRKIIDTSLIQEKSPSPYVMHHQNTMNKEDKPSSKGYQKHRSHKKHKHRSKYSTNPDPYVEGDRFEELAKYGERKHLPEYITFTKEAERRKAKLKAEQKRKEKAMKYKQGRMYAKYGGHPGGNKKDFIKESYMQVQGKNKPMNFRSGFSNGGQYKLKRGSTINGQGPSMGREGGGR